VWGLYAHEIWAELKFFSLNSPSLNPSPNYIAGPWEHLVCSRCSFPTLIFYIRENQRLATIPKGKEAKGDSKEKLSILEII